MAKCYDCGLKYGGSGWIEAIIPDKVWDAIRPKGKNSEQGSGILCVNCISKRISKAGFETVPIWFCGLEPLQVIPGDPSECLPLVRNWEPKRKN